MDISTAIVAPNASIFVTEFSQYGSLLDINNRIRQGTTKVRIIGENFFDQIDPEIIGNFFPGNA